MSKTTSVAVFVLLLAIESMALPVTTVKPSTTESNQSVTETNKSNETTVAKDGSDKRMLNALKLLTLLNEEDAETTDEEAEKEETDFNDFLATLISNVNKRRRNKPTTRTTTLAEDVESDDVEADEKEQSEFDEFLAALLINMDKRRRTTPLIEDEKLEAEGEDSRITEADQNADFDEVVDMILANLKKRKSDKKSSTVRTTTSEAEDIDENPDAGTFDNFLANLLVNMDKHNPFVLHKDQILNLHKGDEEDEKEEAVGAATTTDSSTTSSVKDQLAAFPFLRTGVKRSEVVGSGESPFPKGPEASPLVAAATNERSSEDKSSEWKFLIFGTVSSTFALVLSIVAIAAIGSVIYYRKHPKHQLPLLSPRLPLFSPSEGFSSIYKNRKFNIPKKSRKEAEEYKKTCEQQQQQHLQQTHETASALPEVDEAHYSAHDFLNASLSSI